MTTQQERLAKEARAVEISDHGGDSACWAHLLCPECGAISSEGHHRGCESEQVRVSNGSVAMDQALTASMSTDRMDSLPSAGAEVLAERHLVRRVMIWMAIFVPAAATFFALLVYVAVRTSGVPAGAPVAIGAGIGVLAGVFFGMWAGVVASVEEMEHSNLVLTRPSNS